MHLRNYDDTVGIMASAIARQEHHQQQNVLRYRKGCHRCGADGHLARDCPIWNSEEHKLYVKGLPKTYSNLDVTELFSQFGKIIRCTVLLSKKREDYGRHLGCALVTYASKSAAQNAVEKMHNSKILKGADRPLQVTFGGIHHQENEEDEGGRDTKGPVCYKCGDGGHVARECPIWEQEGFSERRLYVKGLPKTFTDQNVYHLFSPFGKVLKCHVLYHKLSGEPLGCALVTYAKTDSAHLAIDKLNNSTTMDGADRPLQVMFSAKKDECSVTLSPTDGGKKDGPLAVGIPGTTAHTSKAAVERLQRCTKCEQTFFHVSQLQAHNSSCHASNPAPCVTAETEHPLIPYPPPLPPPTAGVMGVASREAVSISVKSNACYICGACGHFARECPKWENDDGGGVSHLPVPEEVVARGGERMEKPPRFHRRDVAGHDVDTDGFHVEYQGAASGEDMSEESLTHRLCVVNGTDLESGPALFPPPTSSGGGEVEGGSDFQLYHLFNTAFSWLPTKICSHSHNEFQAQAQRNSPNPFLANTSLPVVAGGEQAVPTYSSVSK